eukprot:1159283-Pelagomonas_calceolata.AAC.3
MAASSNRETCSTAVQFLSFLHNPMQTSPWSGPCLHVRPSARSATTSSCWQVKDARQTPIPHKTPHKLVLAVARACRSDLLQAVVPRMAASDAEIRNTACSAIRALLASPDTTGKVALEALQLVADLIRRRKWVRAA